MQDVTIPRVTDPADPRRCQAVQNTGRTQCWNQALEGSSYCICHGGMTAVKAQMDRNIYQLKATRMKARLQAKSINPDVLSLREEIGILRIMLEDKLNQVGDSEHDLLAAAPYIGDLIMKVEKVVQSAERIEARRGEVLDRKSLISFAARLSQAAANQIQDPDKIKAFLEEVESIVESIGKDEEAEGEQR